mgnify:CR=1 FL=1
MSVDLSLINASSDEEIELMLHRVLVCHPRLSWLKADIQDWLTYNMITWSASETKTQLLEKL